MSVQMIGQPKGQSLLVMKKLGITDLQDTPRTQLKSMVTCPSKVILNQNHVFKVGYIPRIQIKTAIITKSIKF